MRPGGSCSGGTGASRARRRGIGSVLLRAAEAETRALGRTLLFLDTEAGSAAETLYHGLGYTRVEALVDAASPTAIAANTVAAPQPCVGASMKA